METQEATAIAGSQLFWTALSVILSVATAVIVVVIKDTAFKTMMQVEVKNLKEAASADRKRFIEENIGLRSHVSKHAEAITTLRGDQQWTKEFAEKQNNEISAINKTLIHLNEGITKLEASLGTFVSSINSMENSFSKENKRPKRN